MSSNASLQTIVQRAGVVLGLLMLAGGLMANTLVSSQTVQFDPQAEYAPADEQGRYSYMIDFVEPSVIDQHRSRSSAKFERSASSNVAWRSQLQSLQAQRVDQMSQALGRSVSPSHYYFDLRNGISLKLEQAEAERIASLDGVKSVERVRLYSIDTFRGPDFIGAPAIWDGSATPDGSPLRGELMVAAILDSGIGDPTVHPSFDNDPDCGHGVGGVPDKVLSNLDCSSSDVDGLCNGTLNPFDENGHGSHTASTTAGNRVTNADSPSPELPAEFDSISGVAYCAHIRSYDVCSAAGGNSCAGNELQAAFQSVLIHTDPAVIGTIPPVSVMNYSISGGRSPWNDFDRDKLDLVDAGVFVAASAGNTSAGEPDPVGLVSHRGPWVMSVAASTHDGQIFDGNISLDGGPQGVAALEGSGPPLGSTYTGQLRWAGDVDSANNLGCDPFPAGSFDGEAALIERGVCPFADKVTNATDAGANFVIVFTDDRAPVNMAGLEASTVSAFMVSRQPGLDMATALGGGTAEVTVEPEAVGVIDPAAGDILAGFSLRGPTPAPLQDLQKPNITAPGVNIYAADVVAGGAFGFGFKSGTSMSSPHVAGSAVLVRQANPDWTVSETKSAMQMTASRDGLKDDSETAWDWDDVGHGRVDLNDAALAGFVMDESIANYLAADPVNGGDVKTLNTPDIRNVDCSPSCSFTRTIRNTYDVATDWTVTVDSFGSNVDIQVTPATFSFTGDTTETQEITIEVEPLANMNGEIEFGVILFDEDADAAPQAHFTTAIAGNLSAPAAAEIDQTEFSLLAEVDSTVSTSFNITNVGTGGAVEDLTYDIQEAQPSNVTLGGGPTEPVDLVIDGGIATIINGGDQQWLWMNQFTPGPLDLPFTLESVDIGFAPGNGGVSDGDLFDVYIWTDPDRDPTTGADFVVSVTGEAITPGVNFQTVTLPGGGVPITVDSGDVLIGVVNRTSAATYAVAVADNPGTSQERSWAGLGFPGGVAGSPPEFDQPGFFGLIDAQVPGRNWTIRGSGTGGSACLQPSDVSWLSVTPSSGAVPVNQSQEVVVEVDTTGLAEGDYEARLCLETNDPNNPIFVLPVDVTVTETGGLPTIDLSDASISTTVDVLNTAGSTTFDITNQGTALDLSWMITEASTSAAGDPNFSLLSAVKDDENRFVMGALDGSALIDSAAFGSLARYDSSAVRSQLSLTEVVSVDGQTSATGYGNPDGEVAPNVNSSLLANIGENNLVIGAGWEVNIETFGGSWLSEASVAIVSEEGDQNGLFVSPGAEIGAPGNQSFSSDGLLLFADSQIPPIAADANGDIYIEFYETFDDDFFGPLGVDAAWSDSSAPAVLDAGLSLLVAPRCEFPSDVSWLSVAPASGTTAAGDSTQVTVNVNAEGLLPGTYEALLCVTSNDPSQPLIQLPVEMVVELPATAARVEGTVQSLGRCEANPFDAAGAAVEVVGSSDTFNLVADQDGFYRVFLDEANGPVEVTASAPEHIAETQTGIAIAGETTTEVDFGLVQLVACADVDDDPLNVTLETGETGAINLAIDNTVGAAPFDWNVDTEATTAADPRGHFPEQPWEGAILGDFSVTRDPYFEGAAPAPASDGRLDATAGVTAGPIAYTTTGFSAEGYVSLDVTDPGNLTIITADQPLDAWAATFIDNDFTQQFALGSTGNGDIPLDTFGTIDVATGIFTAIGDVTGTGPGVWLSMKWDPTTSTLYALKQVDQGGTFVDELFTIDLDTLAATSVGVIAGGGHIAIAINNAGQMYGLNIGTDTLSAIDKTDATAVTIGPLNLGDANFIQDMDFDRLTDTLYWSAYLGSGDSRMTTIDLGTGAATEVGTIAGQNEFLSMSIATPSGPPVCSDPSVIPWLVTAPNSGTAEAGESDTLTAVFDARGLDSGIYQARVCVRTTDPDNELIAVPVNMTVRGDSLFSDRFEE